MTERRVTVRACAKINLDLRVLNKNPDGFHELRTVFQTISLADTLDIEYQPARRTELELEDPAAIPGNLVLRAAEAALHAMRVRARVRFRLAKRIPMGGGLGGGSSDAAAVLLALPVLAGRVWPLEDRMRVAASLGSDVPFFLLGGTAVGLDRGGELYPLADVAAEPLLLITPGLHVATAEAYRALGRDSSGSLTFTQLSNKIGGFQSFVRALVETRSARVASAFSANDFEAVVFRQYPQLKTIQAKLRKLGAAGARMTGSGSAMIGVFRSRQDCERARRVWEGDRLLQGAKVLPARLLGRRAYQRMWTRQLAQHVDPDKNEWPPRSRYAR
jgi:4-diphosphocytidyl-2-C-methyl-D-erythritol kinase